MNWNDFRHWGRRAADWASDYHAGLRDRPVRAQTAPGAILSALPGAPPETAEDMEDILADFEATILPGMTHWQHPRFFAYFPANAAPVSVLAEYYVSAIAAQCMLWQTSPAATELETRVTDWMRQAVGLRPGFAGVIQDSASSATLCAVLTMRERALRWRGNATGLSGEPALRVYASAEVHSSIDRAIWIAGIGAANLVRIPTTGPGRAMDTAALRRAIAADRAAGHLPAGIVACVGGTSAGATDDIAAVMDVAEAEALYTHVDAAWAGSAMICPEFQPLWAGVDRADSVVLNPHKWLGAQFDCTTHFVADPDDLVRTLAIQPEYLRTHGADGVIDYSEWSVPLGRRFRALKLWFLIRVHGLVGLRAMIRDHVAWAQGLARRIAAVPGFEIVTPPMLSLFTFRYAPPRAGDLDALNQRLVNTINDDGRIYLTQTRIDGALVVRFQAGAFTATAQDVDMAFEVITEIAATL
ncbi:pyridoxal phosphate-dependent decarboxylase family protein [Sulfitobacter sabulilitoris]|uniref:Aspartate aminotransferase family protein n=1 Tax=Sulfitobacter sabulilitoris TaxID=2562655 RepID=A0A5S3PI65_9RHOB|nr:pyridoxal-dependent decarboxylase [Sulfitobacter sabulilitoris]TMM54049.1 aspartate aminotransferase family protein [Sulfitobacter sabulilitoris]